MSNVLNSKVQKSPQAFRTISEVALELEVPQHVLRFWESKFSQVKPLKRGGRRRYYRPEDVELLCGIRTLLYDDGFTIKGVQKVFRERGVKHVVNSGKTGTSSPDLVYDSGQLEEDASLSANDEAPAAAEQLALNGPKQELTGAQRRQLKNVLNELLELKELIVTSQDDEQVTRSA